MKTTATITLPEDLGLRMKIFFLMIFLCAFISGLNSANPYEPVYDSLTCLEIEGKILISDEDRSLGCTVELIGLDGKTDTLILKENRRKFKLVLGRNTYYTIRISKKGYVSKLISVNTEVGEQRGHGNANCHYPV
jgi:hypothetical protein